MSCDDPPIAAYATTTKVTNTMTVVRFSFQPNEDPYVGWGSPHLSAWCRLSDETPLSSGLLERFLLSLTELCHKCTPMICVGATSKGMWVIQIRQWRIIVYLYVDAYYDQR